MSSEEIVLSVKNLSKHYEIYEKPGDRLKQFIFPKIARLFGRTPKKYYREFAALDNVSFDIKKGETVGIIGCNGSGKSTLLQIICGTLASTSGFVESRGRIAALLELGSGFNPEFTGRENVRLSAMIMGLSAKQVEQKMTQILEFADIGEFVDQPVRTYSSGMFMRLAFSVQAHVDPDLLIVDEALAVGDAYFTHKCMGRFHEMKRKGVTILLVTHDSTAIKTLCDKAIWLADGRLINVGSADQVVGEYLANIDGMERVNVFDKGESKNQAVQELSKSQGRPPISPTSRWGNQAISIADAYLLKNDVITEVVTAGDYIEVLMHADVRGDMSGLGIVVGYTLKNIRGVDIASNNNAMEGILLSGESLRKVLIVRMKVKVPFLHPGQYSLTLNFTSKDLNGNLVSLDHCENVIRFTLESSRECHVLMTLPTTYSFYQS